MKNFEIDEKAKDLSSFLNFDIYTSSDVRELLEIVNDNENISALISICSKIANLKNCVEEMQNLHDTLYPNLDVENAALDMLEKLDKSETSFLEARNEILEDNYFIKEF